ncbi:hypothetical protein [Nitrospirillum amazonense]|uniref:hypothetical protein n=1 Tax=Nitrospirillum amazonense TaxID=28077 RepID=UPI0024129B35|nr:hypothetical protein [Nitrospirillum amazonense]MDG3439567.1 hypothetical protein [Nitrospirillum amazonense]
MSDKEQPADALTAAELAEIERRLGDKVAAYTTIITKIEPNDERNPPGDLHGSGSYIEFDGQKYLITCDHVAESCRNAELCAHFHGSDVAYNLPNPFTGFKYPQDFSITAITENTWKLVNHQAEAISIDLLSERHSPAKAELMYVAGFPWAMSRVWPGDPADADGKATESGVQFYTTIAIMCEIREEFDPALDEEVPRPTPEEHFLLPYTPEHAVYMSGPESSVLPRAPGMSGSLVWNTRYWEITRAGGLWQPEDARVTGIIWGNSTKAGVLVATPVEDIWVLIGRVRKNLEEGRNYWD